MQSIKSYTDKPKRKPYFKHNVVYCKKVFIVSEENYPIGSDTYSEPIDACVAMIEKLNELNLL